jgi:hypothetical protein
MQNPRSNDVDKKYGSSFPEVDDARSNIQQTPPKTVDQAAVERATWLWRESPKYPGEGDRRFFEYALSLRSAGMSSDDIERMLQDPGRWFTTRTPGQ